MELTSDQQRGTRTPTDGSDEELSATFRAWVQSKSATQIRHLLSHCSAEGLAEYTRQNNLAPHDSHRIWRLLKTELVNHLQALTAPADPGEIKIVRHWANALTPEESSAVLMDGSLESFTANLRARHLPIPSDLPRLWALLENELLARTESMNASRVGTA